MRTAAIAAALLLASCASVPRCASPLSVAIVETVYFGTGTPDGALSDEAWNAFLVTVVTPRLPQGFTTWDASGQWRNHNGTVERERTHLLRFVHAPGDDAAERLEKIIEEYRRQFKQEAVLRTQETACAEF